MRYIFSGNYPGAQQSFVSQLVEIDEIKMAIVAQDKTLTIFEYPPMFSRLDSTGDGFLKTLYSFIRKSWFLLLKRQYT